MRALYVVALGAMLAFVIDATPVQAQSTIVYVSASGNNSNSCTFALPCRTLQKAVNVVPSGGVVQVLNSAGYGNLTIAKFVTISGGGHTVALGTRIRINSASAVVVLRDFAMNGLRIGGSGILISNATAIHIVNVEVENYPGDGIRLNGANTKLFVADSVSRYNGSHGLFVNGGGSTPALTVGNSGFENNAGNGLWVDGGTANVTWTTAANNSGAGYAVGGAGELTLESSVARGNANGSNAQGLFVSSTGTARISNSVFTNNDVGIHNNGTLLTRQNNTVSGNGTDLIGPPTTLLPM